MSTQNTGGPAFPQPDMLEEGSTSAPGATGMTLRDYFAAKAMQGHMANPGAGGIYPASRLAYEMADAMLKAREA